MASSIAQMASLVVLCMVVSAPLAQAAVTCGQVTSSVAPCIGYLTRGGAVPAPCCNGIKALNAAAKTTPDRQQTCKCLKSVASSIHGINYGFASVLPAKCGVSAPFKISPATDCNSVK